MQDRPWCGGMVPCVVPAVATQLTQEEGRLVCGLSKYVSSNSNPSWCVCVCVCVWGGGGYVMYMYMYRTR